MQDEEILGKAYDSRLMKRLLLFLKPYRTWIIVAILLNIVIAGLGPMRPYLTKIAIDDFILKNDSSGLQQIALALFGVLILQAVIQYLNNYFTSWIGQRTIYDLRITIFSHLQKLSLRFFDKTPIGRMVTRVTNDVETLNELFSSGIVMVFSDIFIIVWILIFMFMMDVKLSLVTMSVLPLLVLVTMWFRKGARDAYRQVRTQLARINTFIQEHITGINVVQIFRREENEFQKFKRINQAHTDAHIRSVFYYAIFYPAVEIISAIAIGLILWYGGGEVMQQTISLGVLISFIQYTEMFFRPIRDLSEKYNIMQSAMASSERIFALLDDDAIIHDNAVKRNDGAVDGGNNGRKGTIEFRNVWFRYDDSSGRNTSFDYTFDGNSEFNRTSNIEHQQSDAWILKNVSFIIESGTTTAFVGATGAGKSTIVNLLLRFYEIQKGAILIDGIDIRLFPQNALRKRFAVVLQDVFLFSDDITNNITLGNDSISLEKVKRTCEIVGAHIFIEQLPKKYDEEVKERGATLSVGQKQLLAFARALVTNPEILILDEATSSVDTETERLIQNAITELLKDRTAIVVAHRLSTIQHADNIIVLHKGEVRESGTHQELLVQGGIYFKLYQLQFRGQEELFKESTNTTKSVLQLNNSLIN
ncbi:MAG: ABC transporter ATP-binding protein [Ignavibacteria bacterium]|nr:ABC transporter ATP-binding protein [Ignavibacteria bacterium]